MSKIPRENRPGYWDPLKRLNRGNAQFRIAVQIVRIHDVAHVPEAGPVMTAICASLAPFSAARVTNVPLKSLKVMPNKPARCQAFWNFFGPPRHAQLVVEHRGASLGRALQGLLEDVRNGDDRPPSSFALVNRMTLPS